MPLMDEMRFVDFVFPSLIYTRVDRPKDYLH
jgi:hypothetical protein